MASLQDCLPKGYQDNMLQPTENEQWIRQHIFANTQHKLINAKKDQLLACKSILCSGARDLGGRATRSEALEERIQPIQSVLLEAQTIWKVAHDYLGAVQVLNCIINRPLEPNMSALELANHVERAKAVVSKNDMEVPAALMELLDNIRVPDP